MLVNKMLLNAIKILLVIFAIFLFSYYFSVFFIRRKKRITIVLGYTIFAVWQLMLLNTSILPVYINISVTIVITFISAMCVYEGKSWNKCIFALAFNAIWMMIETVSGYILSIYCNQFIYSQMYGILGSVISKILFLLIIFALRKIFSVGGITEFSVKYSIMLIIITYYQITLQ